jgi:hypothetical protein
MRKYCTTVVLAVALAAVAAPSSNATTMFNSRAPIGIGSNTAAVAGSTGSNLAASVLGVTGSTVSCPDTTFTVTGVTTTDVRIDPAYGPPGTCVYSVSGTPVSSASVNTTGVSLTLTATHGAFNSGTGAGSDYTVDLSGTIVLATGVGCTLTFPPQSGQAGGTSLQSQNVDSTGVNTTSASPWGSKFTANSLTLTYTASGSCPGIAEHGTDFFISGGFYLKNVWGSL